MNLIKEPARLSTRQSPTKSPLEMKVETATFTIIELLAVIAIIAILASLLLPTLRSARESAKSIYCSGNMKRLMFAFNMYASDYANHSPLVGGRENGHGNNYWNTLPPYMGAPDYANMTEDAMPKLVVCPSAPREWGRWHYSQPYSWWRKRLQASDGYADDSSTPQVDGLAGGVPLTKISHPSGVMSFGEARPYKDVFSRTYGGYQYYGFFSYPDRDDRVPDLLIPDMHGRGMNTAFVDGHVKFLPSSHIIFEYNKGENNSILFWDLE